MGAIAGLGKNRIEVFEQWRQGKTAIKSMTRFDAQRYQTGLAAEVDPAWATPGTAWIERLTLTACQEALADAGPEFAAVAKTARVLFVLATTKGDLTGIEQGVQHPEKTPVHALAFMEAVRRSLPFAVSFRVISLACASGAAAIAHACEALQADEADAALVVGVDVLSDFVLTGFSSLKSLDTKVCRPFDAARQGLSLGEAAAAVLIAGPGKATTLATQGHVLGWGLANDAVHLTAPARDGRGLIAAIQKALKKAEVERSRIGYINAHGTGTLYNDAMEGKAIAAVFDRQRVPVSTIKGSCGHTLGAAGVLETVMTMMALTQKQAPPTVGLTNPGIEEKLDFIIDQSRELSDLGAGLSLFAGFGGFNAALVLSLARKGKDAV